MKSPGGFTAMPDSHPKVKLASLNSWKEIAVYLDRGIRTVQRWERELALPVHRIGRGPRSPVHAFPAELQAWLIRVGTNHISVTGSRDHRPPHPDGALATSRVLVRRSAALAKQMMDSLWIQRQRTAELLEALDHVRQTVQAQRKKTDGSSNGDARQFAAPNRPGGASAKQVGRRGGGKKRRKFIANQPIPARAPSFRERKQGPKEYRW